MPDALPYSRGTRVRRLLGVRCYLNNYITMYMRLSLSRIHADLAFPTYLGLGII